MNVWRESVSDDCSGGDILHPYCVYIVHLLRIILRILLFHRSVDTESLPFSGCNPLIGTTRTWMLVSYKTTTRCSSKNFSYGRSYCSVKELGLPTADWTGVERLGRICGRNNLSVGFNYFVRWIIRKDGRNMQWAETAVVGFCSMASPSVDTCDVYGRSHIVVKYFITVSTVKQWIIIVVINIIITMVIKN